VCKGIGSEMIWNDFQFKTTVQFSYVYMHGNSYLLMLDMGATLTFNIEALCLVTNVQQLECLLQ